MLGVHLQGFPGGNSEKLGVEGLDIVQEPPPAGVHHARGAQVFGIVFGDVIAVFGNFLNGVLPFGQQFPVAFGIVCPSRETAGHPHNGYGLLMFFGVDDLLRGELAIHKVFGEGSNRGEFPDYGR